MTDAVTDHDLVTDLTIPARHAGVIAVRAGDVLDVVDLEGQQVGDLIAYRPERPDEYLSPAHTTSCLTKLVPEVGDELFSNHRTPLLRIVRDDVGNHDFVVPCCDHERYARDYDVHDHRSCLGSLQEALDAYGSTWDLRGELAANVFMNNVLTPEHRIETHEPPHGAGSTLRMEVLEDLVVGLSACPQDLSACNAFNPTSMALRAWRPRTA